LNFDGSSAVLPTVEGSIKGQHVYVLAWGYWSGSDCMWDLRWKQPAFIDLCSLCYVMST